MFTSPLKGGQEAYKAELPFKEVMMNPLTYVKFFHIFEHHLYFPLISLGKL